MHAMPDEELTPLGELLEQARTKRRMARRAAARRAHISDSWWRSVARGTQVGREHLPANPTPQVVVAMANAVGVDPVEALRVAGFEVSRAEAEALLADWEAINKPEEVETPPLPRELDDLIAIYLSADDTEREVILGQVRFLLRAVRPAREHT